MLKRNPHRLATTPIKSNSPLTLTGSGTRWHYGISAKVFGWSFLRIKPDQLPFTSHSHMTFLKTFYGSFEGGLLNIMDLSRQTGTFPAAYKNSSGEAPPEKNYSSMFSDTFNNKCSRCTASFSEDSFSQSGLTRTLATEGKSSGMDTCSSKVRDGLCFCGYRLHTCINESPSPAVKQLCGYILN